MRKRKFERTGAEEASLRELLDRLEQALTEMPARTSVCRALSDLTRRLSSASDKTAARPSRWNPARRQGQPAVKSLPLFS
ncbi:hypothetical protein R75465_07702 [Paraburkholderia aspalathi]|nr:hypothetical protein R75465_07702 [Paraburkholderia aspalathi]